MADVVRSLTVVPPWSLAIVKGWKPVENRTRNLAGQWCGRVLVLSSAGKWNQHAAGFISDQTGNPVLTRSECHPGHYVGAVDLVDVHRSRSSCCGPFGEPDVWHLQLANAVEFATPVRATGHLGLRRITATALIHAATTTTGV